MNKLILIGSGGHSKVIQDIAAEGQEFELYAVLDDAITQTGGVGGVIYANTSYLSELNVQEYKFCLAVGSNAARKQLSARLAIPRERYAVLIHPKAVVSRSAQIGYGTVIMPNTVVNAGAVIGDHCIINTSAVVEHDNILGNYIHISPTAALSGTVMVGEGTHVGTGAVVIPGRKIGSWSTVGAGAVVVKDVDDDVTVVGVPAGM